jgi:hypothetical protein
LAVLLASKFAGRRHRCASILTWVHLPRITQVLRSFTSQIYFHAQANPEPNRVGREATFYTRPLASFLSFSQRTRSARGRCLGRVSLVSNYDGSGTRGRSTGRGRSVPLTSEFSGRLSAGALVNLHCYSCSFTSHHVFTLRRTLSSTGLAARPRFIPGR